MIIEAWKPFYAGGQVHCRELCKRLIERYDCEIKLYTRRLKVDGIAYKKDESYFNGKLKIIRAGVTTKYESIIGKKNWVCSVFFRNLFKKYDIIHGQANLGGLPAKMLGVVKRRPVVFTVHGSGLDVWGELGKGLIARINRFVEKFLQTGIKYDAEISVDLFDVNGIGVGPAWDVSVKDSPRDTWQSYYSGPMLILPYVVSAKINIGVFTFDGANPAAPIDFDNFYFDRSPPIPEPASLLLLGTGLVILFSFGRKRK